MGADKTVLTHEGELTVMTERTRSVAGSTIILVTTLIMSLLVAVLRRGPSVIATLSLPYMFVIFCFAGAVLYSILKYRGPRNMVFSVFIVTLVHLLLFKITEPRYFIELFLYYAALGASVLIYHEAVMPRMARIRIGKFIVLAALIVVIYSVVTLIVSLFSSGRSLLPSLAVIASVHTFTGIALGLGIEIGELLIDRFLPPPLER